MLHGLPRHWCLLLLCFIMLTSAFHLPQSPSHRVPELHALDQSFEQDHEISRVKRFSDKNYAAFYRLMARHGRYHDEQAFVEKMFRLFDMNSDEVIERDEFRAILQLLGIISHQYRD